jgi:kynurenine formamidase
MPYILSPIIEENEDPLWFEGAPYTKENIYRSDKENSPPVQYDKHILKAHSLPHMEAPLHTNLEGASVDHFFHQDKMNSMFGEAILIKLKGNHFKKVSADSNLYLWEVTKDQLEKEIKRVGGENYFPEKLMLTICDEELPQNKKGRHDQNYILILSQEAADYLISFEKFNAYVTSWKSSDFQPGKKDRPVHNTLFKKAAIYECMNFVGIPEGKYFFVGMPLPLKGASESPCCPVLFSSSELSW